MRVIERTIQDPAEEGVILEYVKFTKVFFEIKEYVRHKGDTIMGIGSYCIKRQAVCEDGKWRRNTDYKKVCEKSRKLLHEGGRK